jgi:hypothetical protein
LRHKLPLRQSLCRKECTHACICATAAAELLLRDAVALFKSEAAAGDSISALSAFAQETLPTLEHHKNMADALAASHES